MRLHLGGERRAVVGRDHQNVIDRRQCGAFKDNVQNRTADRGNPPVCCLCRSHSVSTDLPSIGGWKRLGPLKIPEIDMDQFRVTRVMKD
jgi:hypothetical protein